MIAPGRRRGKRKEGSQSAIRAWSPEQLQGVAQRQQGQTEQDGRLAGAEPVQGQRAQLGAAEDAQGEQEAFHGEGSGRGRMGAFPQLPSGSHRSEANLRDSNKTYPAARRR
jgi:hypothetical protein